MSRSVLLLILFAAATAASCRPTTLPAPALRAYLADPGNGLIKTRQLEGLKVTVSYQPADLLGVVPEMPRSQAAVLPIQSQYFLLALSRGGREALDPQQGFSAFSGLLQTLAFRSQDYLKLTTASGDTLLPSNCELERTYGMGSETRLLVAFPLKGKGSDVTLHLSEFGLATGPLRFDFKSHDLLTVPKLYRPAPTGITALP